MVDPPDVNDLLVRSVKDTKVFAAFVAACEDHVRAVAWTVLHNTTEVDDAVQETFLKVFQAQERYEARGALTEWVCKIARRCALDVVKKRQRPHSLDAMSGEDGDIDRMKASQDETAAADAKKQDLTELVLSVIPKLTPSQQKVFERRFRGRTNQQIADELGMSYESAAKHYSDAVQKVRDLVGAQDGQ